MIFELAYIKLKDFIDFKKLEEFGFQEDPANCEPGDHHYHMNNYFIQIDDHFRITVNMIDRHIDVLCLAEEKSLYNIFNLKPLFDLIASDLVEVVDDTKDKLESQKVMDKEESLYTVMDLLIKQNERTIDSISIYGDYEKKEKEIHVKLINQHLIDQE